MIVDKAKYTTERQIHCKKIAGQVDSNQQHQKRLWIRGFAEEFTRIRQHMWEVKSNHKDQEIVPKKGTMFGGNRTSTTTF